MIKLIIKVFVFLCGVLPLAEGVQWTGFQIGAPVRDEISSTNSTSDYRYEFNGKEKDDKGEFGESHYIYFTSGKVGIGTPLTNNPNNYSRAANGKIATKDLQIEAGSTKWADYVFEVEYNLPALGDVEKDIRQNKHLEGIPSAKANEKEGYSIAGLDVVLVKEIEELTLCIIEQQKQITELQKSWKTDNVDQIRSRLFISAYKS